MPRFVAGRENICSATVKRPAGLESRFQSRMGRGREGRWGLILFFSFLLSNMFLRPWKKLA